MQKHLLFSPLQVGNNILKNRIVMPAMHIAGFTQDGFANEIYTNFYLERAKGGVGTIIVGACDVVENGGSGASLRLNEDRYIPAMQKMVSRIKEHDVTLLAQLYHMGRSTFSKWINGNTAVSSSAVPSPWTGETPRELTISEIFEIIDNYAEAARRALEAGFHGVELHGASGYLIAQFLSPLVNKRQDEFGGSFENRCRFALEVVREIRERTGEDFLIFFRLSGNEFMPGGQGVKEACSLAVQLEKERVDAINVAGGFNESPIPQINMILPRGVWTYLARGVKNVVHIPVIAGTRVNTPELAEKIIREGSTDLVFMGRTLIADPSFPMKAMKGKKEDICPCIGCNQGCFEQSMQFKGATCLMNPRVGHEVEWEIKPAKDPKTVLIVGGGPAGMQAAITCAERGHQVILYEKTDRLGGQMNLAYIPPGRGEFKNVITYLSTQLEKKKISIKYGYSVTEALILEKNPDTVVLATGAQPRRPALPGFDDPRVVFYTDVLEEKCVLGDRIVIIGGGAAGCETAHFLTKMGTLNAEQLYFLARYRAEPWEILDRLLWEGSKKIVLVEQLNKIGRNIGATSRPIIIGELKRHGVRIMTSTEVICLEVNGLRVLRDGKEKIIEADTIVVATGVQSDNSFHNLMQDKGRQVFAIGDAKEPRTALEAIQEGFMVGLEI